MLPKILIIGSEGQLGSELTARLIQLYGVENIFASDLKNQQPTIKRNFIEIDVLNKALLEYIIQANNITQIYHLAAVLSATGEKNPAFAWQLNMDGLLNVLDLSVKYKIEKVYWPSSIAAFGPTTPRMNTPQDTVMDPNTVYGISKMAGELWCRYYFEKFGLDVRSLRYPGIISYKSPPGGGTTDYAIDIFHKALSDGIFTSFLNADSRLPMMYIDDAINATIDLMNAPSEKVKVRTSYNIAAISFTPAELAAAIAEKIPGFEISYVPDFRQAIADSWPAVIDDSEARTQWGWNHSYDLNAMIATMISGLKGLNV